MKSSISFFETLIYAVLAICVLFTYGATEGNPPSAPDPPVEAALKGLQFFEGWTNPRKLKTPMNTAGWEDSAIIPYDGGTLFFGYTCSITAPPIWSSGWRWHTNDRR